MGNNPELSCDKNMHTYYGLLALSSFLCSIWLAIVTCALANICACGGGSERGLICMVIISPLVLGLFFVLSLVIGTVWTFGGDCEAASPSVFKASATLTVCSWVGITLGWPLCAGSTLFVGCRLTKWCCNPCLCHTCCVHVTVRGIEILSGVFTCIVMLLSIFHVSVYGASVSLSFLYALICWILS